MPRTITLQETSSIIFIIIILSLLLHISPSIVQFFYYMCLYKGYIKVCIINTVGFVRAMQDFAHAYQYKYISISTLYKHQPFSVLANDGRRQKFNKQTERDQLPGQTLTSLLLGKCWGQTLPRSAARWHNEGTIRWSAKEPALSFHYQGKSGKLGWL